MLGRDPSHAGLNSLPGGVPEGRIIWQMETDAPFESSPAVVDGMVYVSTGDKRVMALNAESGEVVWETHVGGPVASSPAVAGDLVYVGLRDSRVVALSTASGELVWEHLTGGYIVASPTVKDGIVYIGSSDEILYALDAQTGEEFWSFKAEGRLHASPAVSDEVIGIVSQGREVQVLDAPTGRLRLDFNIAGESVAPPALDGDLLYAADSRGAIVGIDWRQKQLPLEKTGEVHTHPAIRMAVCQHAPAAERVRVELPTARSQIPVQSGDGSRPPVRSIGHGYPVRLQPAGRHPCVEVAAG